MGILAEVMTWINVADDAIFGLCIVVSLGIVCWLLSKIEL